MKTIITALLLSSSLSVISTQALAHTQYNGGGQYLTHNSDRQLLTEVVDSKLKAYENGYEKLQALSGKSGVELGAALKLFLKSNRPSSSIHLDDTSNVTVTELMNKKGDVVYQGVVNASFHYQERDSDN
tara:strand:- start:26078 stop:26464 length:387 start_codon:yes stop_codon:yes gene_type:complete